MLKRYTLNEEMAKMKHLMLFEAGQPQQQAADPMAPYVTYMQNKGAELAQAQRRFADSPNNADARAIQVAFSAGQQGNPRMMDQAIRMTNNKELIKMLQDYKTGYERYIKAHQKTYGSKSQNGVNAAAGSALANAGATQDYNQRLRAQTNAAEAQNDQAYDALQNAKNAYTADYDANHNQWVTGAQNAQNNYYNQNSFTLNGVKTYDGKNVVTQNVQVKYDPQRKGYYYTSGADGNTKTWLTNDQVKGLAGNSGYTNYVNGAADAYRAAYQPSQSAQQNYDNALAAYNSASTNYQSALTTPMVNTWSPQTQQRQAYNQQQTGVQQQQVSPQQQTGVQQQQVQQRPTYNQQQTGVQQQQVQQRPTYNQQQTGAQQQQVQQRPTYNQQQTGGQ